MRAPRPWIPDDPPEPVLPAWMRAANARTADRRPQAVGSVRSPRTGRTVDYRPRHAKDQARTRPPRRRRPATARTGWTVAVLVTALTVTVLAAVPLLAAASGCPAY